jgi:lysophosphatidylcholine acyltransferase/lyso-PAF acetyltransferase
MIAFRLLCSPYNSATVEYCPVYVPSEIEKNDATLYARNVREMMCNKLGVSITEHSYEDVLLQDCAFKSSKRTNTTSVELSKLKHLFNMNSEDIKKQLLKFNEMDVLKKGTINYEELCNFLDVHDSKEMRHLFTLMDENENGEIDFREYLCGLGMISEVIKKIKKNLKKY